MEGVSWNPTCANFAISWQKSSIGDWAWICNTPQRPSHVTWGLLIPQLNDFLSGKRPLSIKSIDMIFKYLGKKPVMSCNWAGKPKRPARRLVGGPRGQFICDSCIDVCNEILRVERKIAA